MILLGILLIVANSIYIIFARNALLLIPIALGFVIFHAVPKKKLFCDYIYTNGEGALVRKVSYTPVFLITAPTYLLTFGQKPLFIPWRQEYYVAPINITKDKIFDCYLKKADVSSITNDFLKISRKEYNTLRKQQQEIYSTQTLDKEFIQENYAVSKRDFFFKLIRTIASIVLSIGPVILFYDVPIVAFLFGFFS